MRPVFISTGRPDQAAHFKERMKLASAVWVDPDRATYKHLGFKRGYAETFGPRTALNYARAMAKGYMSISAKGDVLQQGGVLAVARGGEPVYVYASLVAGDMPPMEKVLEAAREAASR